jgi:hypothetical protein
MQSLIRRAFCGAALVAALATTCWAANIPGTTDFSPEEFTFEVTGSMWDFGATGTVSGVKTSLDLEKDLGIERELQDFSAKLTFKIRPNHRIVVEGGPFQLRGEHTATKTFSVDGKIFTASEPLKTTGDAHYFYAGYQYDFVRGKQGHIGGSVGGVYLNGNGTITAPTAGITASRQQTAGLPLLGVEARVFPIPGSGLVDVDGYVRGMDFGPYGAFVEYSINGGIWFYRRVALQAGYRDLWADLSYNHKSANVSVRGPIFSVVFKW